LTLKTLTTHDDPRKEMSCAYENGKRFLADGIVPSLMGLGLKFRQYPEVASCALSAVRQLVLSEEAVRIVATHGAMTLPAEIMSWPQSNVSLVRSAAGLIRNLCADDMRKNILVGDGTLRLLVANMARQDFRVDSAFMEHALASLAAIALRYPSNALEIVNCGAMEEIVLGMRYHSDKPALQRQGCLAIRNIAARSPELRQRILDAGVEDVLRASGRLQQAVDEAYGALRDLGSEVQFVKVGEDGLSYESAYQTFGGGAKPRFNPVFDETYDIQGRVQDNAVAPFKASNSVFRIDEDDDDDDNDHVHSSSCTH
jgi:armadillo repeat-containing protein 6